MYSPARHDTVLLHYIVNGEERSILISELIAQCNPRDENGEPMVFANDFVFDEDGNKM